MSEYTEVHYINNSTLYKCNNKCNNCSLESIQKDLCITCNYKENYYPKLNDNLNNSFINCYNEVPENYY